MTEHEVPEYIRDMVELRNKPQQLTKRQRPNFEHLNDDSEEDDFDNLS